MGNQLATKSSQTAEHLNGCCIGIFESGNNLRRKEAAGTTADPSWEWSRQQGSAWSQGLIKTKILVSSCSHHFLRERLLRHRGVLLSDFPDACMTAGTHTVMARRWRIVVVSDFQWNLQIPHALSRVQGDGFQQTFASSWPLGAQTNIPQQTFCNSRLCSLMSRETLFCFQILFLRLQEMYFDASLGINLWWGTFYDSRSCIVRPCFVLWIRFMIAGHVSFNIVRRLDTFCNSRS